MAKTTKKSNSNTKNSPKSLKSDKKSSSSSPSKKAKADKEKSSELDDLLIDEPVLGGEDLGEYADDLNNDDESTEAEDTTWSDEAGLNANTPQGSSNSEEIYLTDAEGRRYCRARDCGHPAIVDAYCRYHYLLLWKKIQVRRKILMDGKLEKYVIELTARYPDKFLEVICKDLRTEKDFMTAVQELEIDDSALETNYDDDDSQTYLDEVRGLSETTGVEEEEF